MYYNVMDDVGEPHSHHGVDDVPSTHSQLVIG